MPGWFAAILLGLVSVPECWFPENIQKRMSKGTHCDAVQDPRQMEWTMQESLDRKPAAAEAVALTDSPSLSTDTAVLDAGDHTQGQETAEQPAAADGEAQSTAVVEAAESEGQGTQEEDEPGPELASTADATEMESAPQEGTRRGLQWPWQPLPASHGAFPLSGLRKRFMELFPVVWHSARAPEQQRVQSALPLDSEADQAPPHADAESAGVPLGAAVFSPGQDKLQHFSLHRSHSKMLLSTADTAAAMAEKEAAAVALRATEAEKAQAAAVAGELTTAALEEAPKMDAQREQQPEVAPVEGHVAAAASEREVEAPEQQQEEPAPDSIESDTASEGQEDMLEETTSRADHTAAQEEVKAPATAELMKVETPSLSAPEPAAEQEPADVESEPTAASSVGAPEPSPAAQQPSESTDDKQPDQLDIAKQTPEPMQHASAPALEEAQPQPAPAPQETLPEQAPSPPTQSPPTEGSPTPEALVEEVPEEPASPRASKPESSAAAAAAAAVAAAPESPAGGRASFKAKHSWQSPALSARYGEVEDNEPRYKPRNPSADASASALPSHSSHPQSVNAVSVALDGH